MLFCVSYVFLLEGRCTSYYRHDVEVPLLKAEFEDEKWFEEVQTTRMTGLKKCLCNAYCGNDFEIQVV